MSSLAPSIEVIGDRKAVADLIKLGTRGADVRPVAPEVRAIYLESNRRHLDSMEGWPALADATVQRKTREGLPDKAERATGALYKSLTSESRVKGQKNRVSQTRFLFGSGLFYAPWQQGTKHQPKRELIDLSEADRLAMAAVIGRYVAHGAEGEVGVVVV
jgi:hypothetical protein